MSSTKYVIENVNEINMVNKSFTDPQSIRARIAHAAAKVRLFQAVIDSIRKECPHANVTFTFVDCDTGNYARPDVRCWKENRCGDCGTFWKSESYDASDHDMK